MENDCSKKMTKVILLFFLNFLVIATSTLGQQLTKRHLLADLHYLNQAVINGHPVNYQPTKPTDIQHIIAEVEKMKLDTLSKFEYTIWIAKAIYNIGCIHTSINKNPLLQASASDNYFPCALKFSGGRITITNSPDTSLIGAAVVSINQVAASRISEVFSQYRASDGKTDAFSRQYFQYDAPRLISLLLNNPAFYEIVTDRGALKLASAPKPIAEIRSNKANEYLLVNNANFLTIHNGIPILRFASFAKSDVAFVKKSFKAILAQQSGQLVIDLRQNTGGNRKAVTELTKFLVDSTFGYSILQPKLQTLKYLNGKGKFFFFLSKLKYNVGGFFRGRKTDLGREFSYNYQPKSQQNFDGRIYVLTDGFTASASTMVTSWLKQFTNAKFYGSQAGGGFNGNNGGAFPTLLLPNSKIELTFPAFRLILDKKSTVYQGIIPEKPLNDGNDYGEIIDLINKSN